MAGYIASTPTLIDVHESADTGRTTAARTLFKCLNYGSTADNTEECLQAGPRWAFRALRLRCYLYAHIVRIPYLY